MNRHLRGWMVFLLLGAAAAYAIAEEITLTTYYPSPRGVYHELRTAGNVQIGRIDPPDDPDPNTAPRLHIYRERNAADLSNAPLLLLEDERPNSGNNPDLTPLIIDESGNVGLGVVPRAGTKLDVNGAVRGSTIQGPIRLEAIGAQPVCDATIQFLLWPVAGAAGMRDHIEICLKTALDTYLWRVAMLEPPIWQNVGTRDMQMWHANCSSGTSATLTCDETRVGQEVRIQPGLGVGSSGFEWRTTFQSLAGGNGWNQGNSATILEGGAKLQYSGYVGCSSDELRMVTATIYACGYQ